MKKTLLGRDPVTGRPAYNFEIEESDLDENGEFHVVATGAGRGLVQLADGTTYDVTDDMIAVKSEAERAEVAHHIGVQVEKTGVLDSFDENTGELIKYRHTDCDHCDAPKTHVSAAKEAGA